MRKDAKMRETAQDFQKSASANTKTFFSDEDRKSDDFKKKEENIKNYYDAVTDARCEIDS